MSYYTISIIAQDPYIRQRVAACAAQEGVTDPESWAYRNALVICAEPGWSEAWEYALAADPDAQPGRREDVITDGMIRAAVAKVGGRNAETT